MKTPLVTPTAVLRMIAASCLMLALLFPSWAAELQTVGGYYGCCGYGGGGGGAGGSAAATAVPTISDWGVAIISVLLLVAAVLQRKQGKDPE